MGLKDVSKISLRFHDPKTEGDFVVYLNARQSVRRERQLLAFSAGTLALLSIGNIFVGRWRTNFINVVFSSLSAIALLVTFTPIYPSNRECVYLAYKSMCPLTYIVAIAVYLEALEVNMLSLMMAIVTPIIYGIFPTRFYLTVTFQAVVLLINLVAAVFKFGLSISQTMYACRLVVLHTSLALYQFNAERLLREMFVRKRGEPSNNKAVQISQQTYFHTFSEDAKLEDAYRSTLVRSSLASFRATVLVDCLFNVILTFVDATSGVVSWRVSIVLACVELVVVLTATIRLKGGSRVADAEAGPSAASMTAKMPWMIPTTAVYLLSLHFARLYYFHFRAVAYGEISYYNCFLVSGCSAEQKANDVALINRLYQCVTLICMFTINLHLPFGWSVSVLVAAAIMIAPMALFLPLSTIFIMLGGCYMNGVVTSILDALQREHFLLKRVDLSLKGVRDVDHS